MVVQPSSRRRRWALLAVLMLVAAAVVLFLLLRRQRMLPTRTRRPRPRRAAPRRPRRHDRLGPSRTRLRSRRRPLRGASPGARSLHRAHRVRLRGRAHRDRRRGDLPRARGRDLRSHRARTGASSSFPRGPVRTSSPPCSPRATCRSARSGARARSAWSPRRRRHPGARRLARLRGPADREGGGPGRRCAHRRRHRRAPDRRARSRACSARSAAGPPTVEVRFSGGAPPEALAAAHAAGFADAAEPLRGTGSTRTVTLRGCAGPRMRPRTRVLAGRVVDEPACRSPRRW